LQDHFNHGYPVAALDHSEVVVPEIAGNIQSFIASRVPDRFPSS